VKTSGFRLLKSKMVRAGLLLALAAAAVVLTAWSVPQQARSKLGGTWVGRLGDITWTGTYAPDPSGHNAVITLQWMTLNADFQALNASIGAQNPSLVSGCMSMTSPNTANGKLIWYLVDPGTASATQPVAGKVKGIAVMTLDWRFTSKTTAEGTHNLKMYLPNAEGSLLPEDGTLIGNVNFDKVPHQKIF